MADRGNPSISERIAVEYSRGTLDVERAPLVPGIPTPRADLASLQASVIAIKQLLDTRENRAGSVLDKSLTIRDLMNSSTLRVKVGPDVFVGDPGASVTINSAPFGDSRPDLNTPPVLTTLVATGAFRQILLTWDRFDYRNHAYTEIWRHTSDVIGSAALIGTTPADIYDDSSGTSGVTYYYWVRAVNTAGQHGAFNATPGTSAGLGTIAGVDLTDLIITADKLSQGTYPNVNLVPNPGAEDGVVAWTAAATFEVSAGTFVVDTANKTSGTQAFKLSKANAGLRVGAGCRAFPVIPGETYSYSIKLKGSTAGDGVYVRAYERVAAPPGGYVCGVVGANTADFVSNMRVNLTLTTGFVEYSGTYTATAGAYWCTFMVLLNTAGTCLDVWFDDCKVGRQIVADDIKAATITAGKLVAGTITAASGVIGDITADVITTGTLAAARIAAGSLNASKITAGTITVDRLIIRGTQGSNYVPDPNGVDISAWAGGTAVSVSDSTSPSGAALSCTSVGSSNYLSAAIPIDRAKNYLLRMTVKQHSGTPVSYLGMVFYDAAGANVTASGWPALGTYNYYGLVGQLAPSTYCEFTIAFGPACTAGIPATAVSCAPLVLANYSAAGDFRLTNVVVEDLPAGHLQWVERDVAMEVRGTSMRKRPSVTTGSWTDAGFYSKTAYTGGAYVKFRPRTTAASLMVGLNASAPSTSTNYTTLDYAIYATGGGSLEVYESGVQVYTGGTYAVGDMLSVVYDGFNVRYMKNGTVFRTIAAANGLVLYADSSFNTANGWIDDVEFGPLNPGTQITSGNVTTYVGNLAVDTPQVAVDAITNSVSGTNAGGGGRSTATNTTLSDSCTIGSITTDADGDGKVVVFVAPDDWSAVGANQLYNYIMECSIGATSNATFTFEIKRVISGTPTVVDTLGLTFSTGGGTTRFYHPVFVIDEPGAGVTATYEAHVTITSTDTTTLAVDILPLRYLIQELKK